jgi:hypothetical protein
LDKFRVGGQITALGPIDQSFLSVIVYHGLHLIR